MKRACLLMLAMVFPVTAGAANQDAGDPGSIGYYIDVPAGDEVSRVVPVYCLDPDKDAPANGASLQWSQTALPDSVRRIMLVKEIMLAHQDRLQDSCSEILGLFQGFYKGADPYYRLVDRGTQWALWRRNEKGFPEVVKSRITILEQFAGCLRSIAASLSGETSDDADYARHIAATAGIKDETIRSEVRNLLQNIRQMRESGRLFAVRDGMIVTLQETASRLEKNAGENKCYNRMAHIIEQAAVGLQGSAADAQ